MSARVLNLKQQHLFTNESKYCGWVEKCGSCGRIFVESSCMRYNLLVCQCVRLVEGNSNA